MFYLTSIGLGIILGCFILYMKEKLTKRQKDKLKRNAGRYFDMVLISVALFGAAYLAIQMVIGIVHYAYEYDRISQEYTPQYMRYVERSYAVE